MSHSTLRVARFVGPVFTLAVVATALRLLAADVPTTPALSTLAPAADLEVAAQNYLTKIQGFLVDEATFGKNKDQLSQKANAVVAIAQTLGNYDGKNKFQAGAVDAMKAAADLAKAGDYAAAKTAYDALSAAMAKTGDAAAAPKWEKAARLGKLMHETAEVNSRIRRNVRRFARTKSDSAEDAAVLLAFAQATIHDTHEVKNPADLPKWYAMAEDMRNSAAALSKASHGGDEAGFKAALDKLGKNCDACHEVFHNE